MTMSLTIVDPVLSPSLDEYGNAIQVDPDGNRLALEAVVFPSASGVTGLHAATVKNKGVANVTDRENSAQVSTPGGAHIPVKALMSLDSAGNPVPFVAPNNLPLSGGALSGPLALKGLSLNVVSPGAGTHVVAANEDVIRLTNNNDVATLPVATGSGRVIAVTNVGAGTVTINVAGGALAIKGSNSIAIFTQYSSYIFCDGAAGKWDILGSN
jgi:hypothetical protein